MIALLRYGLLKGVREKSLPLILFGQAIMIGASLLGTGAIAAFKGHRAYPFTLYPGGGAQQASDVAYMAAACAALTAGVAAFTLFRAEIENHSIGFFVLAARPLLIAAAAALCGTLVGVGSFVATIAVAAMLTAHISAQIGVVSAWTVLLCIFGAALAVFLGGISADYGMLLPFLIAVETACFLVWKTQSATTAAATLAMAAVLVGASSPLLERRCAG